MGIPKSEQRILDAIDTRTSLYGCEGGLGQSEDTVEIYDDSPGNWGLRTRATILDRMARKGLIASIPSTDGLTVFADLNDIRRPEAS